MTTYPALTWHRSGPLEAARTGDYLHRPVYADGCTVVEIAYAPIDARAPELRDVVPELLDVPAAIVRLVQGHRPRVTGVWDATATE